MSDARTEPAPRVVIVGGGFGGLSAAKALARQPFDITLIDHNNHHLFQPLLYQVATAGLSPADIALPIRSILSDMFVIGDTAAVTDAHGAMLPGVAPVAKQQGQYVARALIARREGRAVEAFRYRDYGLLATIGRSHAVVQMGRLHITGFPAWVLWSVAHIYFLIGFRNRFVVALNWAWSYITFQRGSRLITGLDAHPGDRRPTAQRSGQSCSFRRCELSTRIRGTSKWKCIRSGIFWPSPGR